MGVSATVQAFLDECAELDHLVSGLPEAKWRRDTPAQGWTIATQIGHLAWTDEIAQLAIADQAGFGAVLQEAMTKGLGLVDQAAFAAAEAAPADLLARWRSSRQAVAEALLAAPEEVKLPWFGPPMGPRALATARLMEVWAHGQDVADALGVIRAPSDRIRDICHLGVRTRDFAYRINGLTPPEGEFRIELTAPAGETWTWGPQDSDQRVTGSAHDFALVVCQRRDASDTALLADGDDAKHWLTIAQAFAGPPRSQIGG